MEHEGSPVIDVVGGAVAGEATEVVQSEDRVVSSSSGESSDSGRESTADSQEEESGAVDSSEASQSYVFHPSTVTVFHIHGMSSLHYFAEGDA
jgi:hypothetical protein